MVRKRTKGRRKERFEEREGKMTTGAKSGNTKRKGKVLCMPSSSYGIQERCERVKQEGCTHSFRTVCLIRH